MQLMSKQCPTTEFPLTNVRERTHKQSGLGFALTIMNENTDDMCRVSRILSNDFVNLMVFIDLLCCSSSGVVQFV